MTVNSEMKHKPKAIVGMIENLVPDFVDVNEKLPITCKFSHKEQFKIHYP